MDCTVQLYTYKPVCRMTAGIAFLENSQLAVSVAVDAVGVASVGILTGEERFFTPRFEL